MTIRFRITRLERQAGELDCVPNDAAPPRFAGKPRHLAIADYAAWLRRQAEAPDLDGTDPHAMRLQADDLDQRAARLADAATPPS